MEYQIAAKWWTERLEYIPDHPDAARRDLENEEKMANLVQNLAEGIKREVDKRRTKKNGKERKNHVSDP